MHLFPKFDLLYCILVYFWSIQELFREKSEKKKQQQKKMSNENWQDRKNQKNNNKRNNFHRKMNSLDC